MMQCPDPSSSSVLSVLERQRTGLQWQASFQTVDDEVNFTFDSLLSPPNSVLSLQDEEYPLHELGNGWPNLPNGSLLGCSPFPRHQSLDSPSASSLKSSRKRKAVKPPMLVVNSAEKDKGIKVVTEEKPNEQSKGETKPENLKNDGAAASPQPPPKQEFIHVRARRGQATDSHSLAERVRRERISERMKYLQGLVPGCDKITGKAGMLDEIINYVQALQRQVEFLSMKLAAVNPWIDFNFDSFFLKELNMVGNLIIPTMEAPTQTVEPSFLGLNPMRQMPPCDGLNVSLNSSDSLFSHPSFNVQNSSWHANSQSISCADFNQEKGPIFPLQSNLKMTNDSKMEM